MEMGKLSLFNQANGLPIESTKALLVGAEYYVKGIKDFLGDFGRINRLTSIKLIRSWPFQNPHCVI